MDAENRRYSDKEAAAIIRRALEIQRREGSGSPQSGTSLDDIQAVGKEVGLTPELIQRAARELQEGRGSAVGHAFLGETTKPSAAATVPRRISKAELERLLVELPTIADSQGSGSAGDAVLTWQTSPVLAQQSGIQTTILVSVRGDHTEIQARENLSNAAGGLFGGLGGGVGLGMGFGVGFGVGFGALGSALFAALFPIGAVVGSYLLARGIYVSVARRRKRKLAEIVEAIARSLGGKEGEALPQPNRPEM
jgi:transposase-like protein